MSQVNLVLLFPAISSLYSFPHFVLQKYIVLLSGYCIFILKHAFKQIVGKTNICCCCCCCFPWPFWVISIDVLNDYIIPGLRAVKQDIEALAPDCEVRLIMYNFRLWQYFVCNGIFSVYFYFYRKLFIFFLKNVKLKQTRSPSHSKYILLLLYKLEWITRISLTEKNRTYYTIFFACEDIDDVTIVDEFETSLGLSWQTSLIFENVRKRSHDLRTAVGKLSKTSLWACYKINKISHGWLEIWNSSCWNRVEHSKGNLISPRTQ